MLGNGFCGFREPSLCWHGKNVWSLSMMSVMVQQTYRDNAGVDRCAFEGHFLVPDDYGHARDKLAYSFDFDRSTPGTAGYGRAAMAQSILIILLIVVTVAVATNKPDDDTNQPSARQLILAAHLIRN
jgi:hypothetical protein